MAVKYRLGTMVAYTGNDKFYLGMLVGLSEKDFTIHWFRGPNGYVGKIDVREWIDDGRQHDHHLDTWIGMARELGFE